MPATVRRLRVRIGPSFDRETQRTITVNDERNPVRIDSEHFSGFIWFRVHQFRGVGAPLPAASPWATGPNETEPIIPDSKYFEGKRRYFSLEFRGRFKKAWTADEIEFGIVLDRKITLPTGADLALRIAQAIDPGLRADLHADQPWTMSPLLCAMNIFNVGSPSGAPIPSKEVKVSHKRNTSSASSTVSSTSPIPEKAQDDGCDMLRLGSDVESKLSLNSSEFDPSFCLQESNTLTRHGTPLTPEERKKYFLSEEHRKSFEFSPDYVYGFDFYNKYLDLGEMRIRLPGFSIDMLKYWDPDIAIRYVCRSKDGSTTFFVVEFDLV